MFLKSFIKTDFNGIMSFMRERKSSASFIEEAASFVFLLMSVLSHYLEILNRNPLEVTGGLNFYLGILFFCNFSIFFEAKTEIFRVTTKETIFFISSTSGFIRLRFVIFFYRQISSNKMLLIKREIHKTRTIQLLH